MNRKSAIISALLMVSSVNMVLPAQPLTFGEQNRVAELHNWYTNGHFMYDGDIDRDIEVLEKDRDWAIEQQKKGTSSIASVLWKTVAAVSGSTSLVGLIASGSIAYLYAYPLWQKYNRVDTKWYSWGESLITDPWKTLVEGPSQLETAKNETKYLTKVSWDKQENRKATAAMAILPFTTIGSLILGGISMYASKKANSRPQNDERIKLDNDVIEGLRGLARNLSVC